MGEVHELFRMPGDEVRIFTNVSRVGADCGITLAHASREGAIGNRAAQSAVAGALQRPLADACHTGCE